MFKVSKNLLLGIVLSIQTVVTMAGPRSGFASNVFSIPFPSKQVCVTSSNWNIELPVWMQAKEQSANVLKKSQIWSIIPDFILLIKVKISNLALELDNKKYIFISYKLKLLSSVCFVLKKLLGIKIVLVNSHFCQYKRV